MDTEIIYRLMSPDEAPAVCKLVEQVFNQFVAPTYVPEGVREFLKYVDPEKLIRRSEDNHSVVVAEAHGRIVGMLEMRNGDHVSLLFVEPSEQKRGIAHGLMQRVIALHNCQRITVHSSPNAEPIYARLGFTADGPEQTTHGIRFVPMTWTRRKERDLANQASQVTARKLAEPER
jgi:GNAT superfamily N-acetyltransferase